MISKAMVNTKDCRTYPWIRFLFTRKHNTAELPLERLNARTLYCSLYQIPLNAHSRMKFQVTVKNCLIVFTIVIIILIWNENENVSSVVRFKPAKNHRNSIDITTGSKERICKPFKNIFFMKTHKTAGTSIMNIIERYAEMHDMTIALPNGANADQFEYPNIFDTAHVFPLLNHQKEFNVICHHMRLNFSVVKNILPKSRAKYVTIVREPIRLFESIFEYYYSDVALFHKVKDANRASISSWLDMAPKLYKENKGGYWFIGKNMEFFDFGFDPMNEDGKYIDEAIQQIESQFDLVMISDYFLESLVLLKELMCWSLEDVRSLKLNSRSVQTMDEASPSFRRKIRNWNRADAALFDYFNATLWRKVEEFGYAKMKAETAKLKMLNEDFHKTCVNETGVVGKENSLFNPGGRVNLKSLSLRNNTPEYRECSRATRGTLQYSAKLREDYLKQRDFNKN